MTTARKKVLLIEDESIIAEMIRTYCADDPIDWDYASDGREGFRRASTGNHDLIVTDLNMPSWEGRDALAALETIGRQVPTVVVTGLPDKIGDIEDLPFVKAVFEKPPDMDELRAKIREILEIA